MFPIYSAAQIPEFTWRAAEVVTELDHKPQLVVRIAVSGGYFPHRALVPMMQIVRPDGEVIPSWFTRISPDNHTLYGYFATDLPEEGVIQFGYGDGPPGRVRAAFSSKQVTRLVRDRLGRDVVVVTQASLDKFRGPR